MSERTCSRAVAYLSLRFDMYVLTTTSSAKTSLMIVFVPRRVLHNSTRRETWCVKMGRQLLWRRSGVDRQGGSSCVLSRPVQRLPETLRAPLLLLQHTPSSSKL